MNGTPWGYIHQKKKAEEASYEKHEVEQENHKLKCIIRKLLDEEPLTDDEKNFLKGLQIEPK